MNRKNLANILFQDRQLMTLFSGIAMSVVALISLVVTAGVWYL
ncbi:hypothetical protein ACFLXL_00575 [Chloroflexota bacterium]